MVAMILLQHVSTVRDCRAAHAEKATELKRRKDEFALATSSLDAEVKLLAAQVDLAEAELKGAALAHFAIHHDTTPCPGVEIKNFNVVEYDAAQAFAWAKASNTALIPEQLDTKIFAKIAAAADLAFVTKRKEPQAQIARDLEKALTIAQATDASVAAALAAPAAVESPTADVSDVSAAVNAASIADSPLPWEQA